MYEAFDSFLRVPTWHTRHANDEERFFCVLRTVVGNAQFSPEAMGDHFDQSPARRNLTAEAYDQARGHYVAAAWAIKRYLQASC